MEGISPRCGKQTMMKKAEPCKYKLVCAECGFQHRMLPKNEKKMGFV